jgi:hypothetical protein
VRGVTMFDLRNFSDADALSCGDALATLGSGASSMEEAAGRIVNYLYDNLGDVHRAKSCALVRFYKTHPYGQLGPELRRFAQGILGHPPKSDEMRCLTLLATRGEEAKWNSRANSVGHKAIPLPSEDFVSRIPMISRLVSMLGLDVSAVIKPDPGLIADLEERTYNAFHVPEAVGSPYIPAQKDFVLPFGVQSVIGFGGVLGTGDLYAVIVFAKVRVPRDVADRTKSLAKRVKDAVQPFAGTRVFATAA